MKNSEQGLSPKSKKLDVRLSVTLDGKELVNVEHVFEHDWRVRELLDIMEIQVYLDKNRKDNE